MNSSDLKAEALGWLRYGKRMTAICTELQLPGWSPDVIGCSPTSVVEVEIKVSKQDFKADFLNKTAKFWRYKDPQGLSNRIPNYFFYLVPETLAATGLNIVKEGFPKAGLLAYKPDMNVIPGRNIDIIKGAERLHDESPSPQFIHEVLLRATSELCGKSWALVKLQKEVDRMFERIDNEIVENVHKNCGALDVENPEADLETRAAELAVCVGGEQWPGLGTERREYWRQASKRLLEAWRHVPEEWHEAVTEKRSRNRSRKPLLRSSGG
jgi:hypothetical protein